MCLPSGKIALYHYRQDRREEAERQPNGRKHDNGQHPENNVHRSTFFHYWGNSFSTHRKILPKKEHYCNFCNFMVCLPHIHNRKKDKGVDIVDFQKYDFFSILSAAATILGAYATWKSLQTAKRLEAMQDLKLDIVIKDIAFEQLPDTNWHNIEFQMTNLSTVSAFVKKMKIQIHNRTYDLDFDESPVLKPFEKTSVHCTLGAWGTDVLDGRYPAELFIETDRKNITWSFKESDFILIFHRVPQTAE